MNKITTNDLRNILVIKDSCIRQLQNDHSCTVFGWIKGYYKNKYFILRLVNGLDESFNINFNSTNYAEQYCYNMIDATDGSEYELDEIFLNTTN